jgi:hypothetical protein
MPASPLLAPTGLLVVALSLTLGWGIRGNYGHETGAMLPGALAAIAACLASGRADWRARVPFFALFGALGWAFGGSISYMQVIGYTHSGHLPSQLYGFAALFLIGFLWGALGGGGTALPAVLDRQRLEGLFPPLLVACAAMSVPELVTSVIEDAAAVGGAMRRQDSPLYWLDSDWLQAVAAIFAMLAYDVVERRFAHSGELLVRGAAGAVAGATIQRVLHAAGLDAHLWHLLVRPQGDPSLFPVEQLVTNWPNALPAAIPHLGSITGLLLGIGSFFARHGRFSGGARLVVMLALGWLAGFLILPVVLGLRLTPPRGDDWAGILGVVVAAILWCRRERLPEVTIAMIVAGTIGGLGFSGAALLKLLMVAPGNPGIVSDPVVVAAWTVITVKTARPVIITTRRTVITIKTARTVVAVKTATSLAVTIWTRTTTWAIITVKTATCWTVIITARRTVIAIEATTGWTIAIGTRSTRWAVVIATRTTGEPATT